MKWVEVKSSSVGALAWRFDWGSGARLPLDDESPGTLWVRFRKGEATYRYEGVPYWIFQRIREAESVGGTMHHLVRKGGFDYRKVA